MESTQHKCRMNNLVESQISTISLSSNLMKARKRHTKLGNYVYPKHVHATYQNFVKKGPVTVVVAETLLEF